MGEDLTKLSKEELIDKINILYYNMNIDTNRIEQLETKERKLIERLENKLKLNNRDIELAENGKLNLSSEEWAEIETENTLINEILSILKG